MNTNSLDFFFQEYKAATNTTKNVYIFICITAFFILIAVFNFRFSWINSEDRMDNNKKRDYWFTPIEKQDSSARDSTITVVILPKDTTNLQKDTTKIVDSLKLNDEYFKTRFFEKRNLGAASLRNEIFEDKRMFLNMESLGVYIYVQDIPLLGGFVVSLLFLWFIFARNNELELLQELEGELNNLVKNKNQKGSKTGKNNEDNTDNKKEILSRYTRGIIYASQFRRSFGKSKRKTPMLISALLWVARSLFVFIWILLFITFVLDVWETHCKGPDFQKYVSASIHPKDTTRNKIDTLVILGRRCDYLMEKSGKPYSDYVFENVATTDLIRATVKEEEASKLICQIILVEFFSALLLGIILIEVIIMHKIISKDGKNRKAIAKLLKKSDV